MKAIDIAAVTAERPARRRPTDEEHRIQCACVNWFRYQYPQYSKLLFAVPNGGARNAATAGKLKAEGVVPGVADLLLLVPGGGFHALCIEMKTMAGRQSDTQKEWQRAAEAQGYRYVVCRSLEDFIREVNAHMKGYITK